MSGLNGDFLGFTFITNGEVHTSQELGITRVSDGDRYNEPLIPEIEDKTIEIPGLDGTYFYGSDFKTRNFSIKIAFDSMTEPQFRKMRQVFGYKHIGLLIFDEAPYKQYRVKVASAPELEFVCFDEQKKEVDDTEQYGVRVEKREEQPYDVIDDPDNLYSQVGEAVVGTDTISSTPQDTITVITRERVYPWKYITDEQGNKVYERIYKGEGTIEFVAYYPFATQVYKTLDEYRNAIDDDGNPIYTNVDEWAEASGLLEDAEAYSEYDYINDITGADSDGNCTVYNAGDIPTGMKIYIPFETSKPLENNLTITNESVSMDAYNTIHPSLTIESALKKQGSDTGLLINMENGLIEGVTGILSDLFGHLTYVTSGNIYNQYAVGMFFKIEPGESMIHFTEKPTGIRIFYNYLYF